MNIECYGTIKMIPVPNPYISIEELKNIVRSRLNIDYPFILTYGAAELCNEDSLHDLGINPAEVIRVRRCAVDDSLYTLDSVDSMNDIFLSYEPSVRNVVRELKRKLEQGNYFSWFDFEKLSNEDLDRFSSAIERGISRSPVFMCCITKKYAQSTKCQQELQYAKQNRKKMILLLMEDLHWPPPQIETFVSGLSYIQFYHDATSASSTPWPSEKFDELLQKLAAFVPQM